MADEKGAERPFHASPILIAPVAASLVIGVLFAGLIISSQVVFPTVTPAPEVGFGPVVNALIFVVLASFGASMIYLLWKHKLKNSIRLLIGFAITVVTFSLSNIYLWMLFSLLNAPEIGFLAFLDSILITAIVDIEVFMFQNVGSELVILGLGGAVGTFLGAAIPTISAVLILLFLAVYDVIAVFRGPVGKMASEGMDQLRGLSFSFRDIQMGLGDLTFYSMLAAHSLIFFGPLASLGSATGVAIGSFFSFKMLEKRGMFPGLPFSIILGLIGMFIGAVL
jgi:hypothetical protein